MKLIHLLLIALGVTMIAWGTSGCATARPDAGQLVRGVNDVLGVLCSTREALNGAREALESGDVGAARDLLKAYLVEHGHDPEVAAVLQLLETQIDRVAWGF